MPRSRPPGLFDAPSPGRRARGGIGPVAVGEDLREIARRLPSSVHLGTSSWSFPGWAGIVYDRKASQAALSKQGLAAYAKHPLLRAAGIDRTFYAPVPASVLAEYAAAVPDDFRFLVKAPQAVTDPVLRDVRGRATGESNPLFLDAEWTAERSVFPFVEGLGEKGGVLLFQFVPLGHRVLEDPIVFAERVAAFFSRLPAGVPYAVEFRDRALARAEVARAVAEAGATWCLNVHPTMPPIPDQRALAMFPEHLPIVVRWMLHAGLRYEAARDRYAPFDRLVDEDPESRSAIADVLADAARARRIAIAIANNKAEGSAPWSLFKLAGAVVERV
jgi:uncharacterized protein YecE (DUF72 family)